MRYALTVAEERTDERDLRVPAEAGLAALRAALLDVLPLTTESTAMSRVWVGFWDGALGDPALAARQTARYERWRERLGCHVEAAQIDGRLPASADPADLAATCAAFTHGLVVQALFAPDAFPPERQERLLGAFLAALGGPETDPGGLTR